MKLSLHSVFLISVLAAPVSTSLNAQNRLWNALLKPAGTQSIKTTGTQAVLRTSTDVYFYSGITKRWISMPASGAAVVDNWNAYATVEDSNLIHAFSSRTGQVETLTPTGGYQKYIGPASANWITVALEQSVVHAYSPFTGKWASQQLSGVVTPTIATGAMMTVVHDGVSAHGFSVLDGKWHSLTAPGSGWTVQALGMVGVARQGSVVLGFAAGNAGWTRMTMQPTASVTLGNGFALFDDAGTITAFSGERATVQTYTPNGVYTIQGGRECAAIVEAGAVVCTSGTLGTFHKLAVRNAVVSLNSEVAVIESATDNVTHAWSPVTGRYSTALPGSYTLHVDESVVFAESTSNGAWAYSNILDHWTQASSGYSAFTTLRDGVVLEYPNRLSAYAPRYGRWFDIGVGSNVTVHFPRSLRGALAIAHDGARMHAFDSRLGRWATSSVGANPNFAIFRVVGLVETGSVAHGFALFGNEWESMQLQGSVTALSASSSIGYVETTSHIYLFSAHGELSTWSRFPEFSRFQLGGSDLTVILAANSGDLAVPMLGFGPGRTSTPIGTLYLDLNLPILPLGAFPVPSDGRLEIKIPLPADPDLRGKAIHLQDFVLPASGEAWLSNSIAPIIT